MAKLVHARFKLNETIPRIPRQPSVHPFGCPCENHVNTKEAPTLFWVQARDDKRESGAICNISFPTRNFRSRGRDLALKRERLNNVR